MTTPDAFSGFPRGLEVLLKKAAVDPAFRRLLMDRRDAAAGEIELSLSSAEAAMLRAMPQPQLEAIIDRTEVPEASRRAFLGRAAAAMLAALGAVAGEVSAGTGLDGGTRPPTGTFGIQPDQPRPPTPPSTPPPPRWARGDEPVKPVDQFIPAQDKPPLTLELVNVPPRAQAAGRITLRIQIANPSASDAVPLVALFNRPGVSAGTGIGIEFRLSAPAAAPPAGGLGGVLDAPDPDAPKVKPKPGATPAPEPDQVPVPERPPFTNRPDDLKIVLPMPQLAPNARVVLSVMLRLPEQPGTYEVRPFLRSWAYAAPDAKTPLDAEKVRKNFIRRIAGEVKTIELTAAGQGQERPAPPPPAPTGIRPDRIPAVGGARPDIPKPPVGGVGGGLIP